MLKSKITAGLMLGLSLSFASASQAASISYFLDQSDKLADGTNYLQVTIADGANGAIDFTVTALQPLLDIAAATGFGITKFAFNVEPGIKVLRQNVDLSSLPKGWVYGPQQWMDGFGRFDRRIRTTNAKTPLSPSISFSIVGIDYDTLASYVELSRDSTEGPTFFSARVAGLNLPCAEPSLPVEQQLQAHRRLLRRRAGRPRAPGPLAARHGGRRPRGAPLPVRPQGLLLPDARLIA